MGHRNADAWLAGVNSSGKNRGMAFKPLSFQALLVVLMNFDGGRK